MNADDPAMHVEERSTRIATDDRAIGADVLSIDPVVDFENAADTNHGRAAGLDESGHHVMKVFKRAPPADR